MFDTHLRKDKNKEIQSDRRKHQEQQQSSSSSSLLSSVYQAMRQFIMRVTIKEIVSINEAYRTFSAKPRIYKEAFKFRE